MKNTFERYLVLLLLLPVVWVYLPNGQDWGGDFAQYLNQAEGLFQGNIEGYSNYVYNAEYYRLAPPTYPQGYPIILATWMLFFGSGISGLVFFQSMLLVLFGLGIFTLVRRHFSFAAALCAALISVYNPWLIRFKVELIADLPFALEILGIALLYPKIAKGKWLPNLAFIALTVLCILTKSHGWVVVVALFIGALWSLKNSRALGLKIVGLAALIGVIAFILSVQFAPHDGAHLNHFSSIAGNQSSFLDTLLANVIGYFNIYEAFFIKDLRSWSVLSKIIAAVLAYAAIVGLIWKWTRRKFDFADLLFLGIMGALLLFPITNGFRYLLPAYPFLLLYSFYGFSWIPIRGKRIQNISIALGSILVMASYSIGFGKILDLPKIPEGPQAERHQALLELVRSLPENTLILTEKPRVFVYYTGVKAFSIHPESNPEEAFQQIYQAKKFTQSEEVVLVDLQSIEHPSIDRITSGERLKPELEGSRVVQLDLGEMNPH